MTALGRCALLAVLLCACGSASSAAIPAATPSPAVASSSPLDTPAATPSPTVASSGRLDPPTPTPPGRVSDSPIPAAGGWETFVNHSAQFTYSVSASWQAESCEVSGQGYAVAPAADPPCGPGEYADAWLWVISLPGDERANLPPMANNYLYVGTVSGSTDVVVAGVQGKRYAAIVDKTLPLPPPLGTRQVLYIFFNGARTYALYYAQWPSAPDRTADFDRSVTTMVFSA